MSWRFLILMFGVVGCSTSVIFLKSSTTHPFVLVAGRLLLTTLLLLPVFVRDCRRHRETFSRKHIRRTFVPALMLTAHFVTWVWGARLSYAAHGSLIINLSPIAMPFFLLFLMKEQINRMEIIGTLIAMIGVLILGVHNAGESGPNVLGSVICFGSMLIFTFYLALGRKNRDFPTLWLYIVPVYFFAGVISLVISIPWLPGFAYTSLREWTCIVGLAVFPTLIGHSLLNSSMRYFRGQIVSLCNVMQVVFATIMAYFIFHEIPSLVFFVSASLVVAGAAMVVLTAPPQPRMR